jgi:hypothetical protein
MKRIHALNVDEFLVSILKPVIRADGNKKSKIQHYFFEISLFIIFSNLLFDI